MKVAVIMECCSGIATRKVFPGTEELAVKDVAPGCGYSHRLGLSETVLVFRQHLNFCGGLDGFIEMVGLYHRWFLTLVTFGITIISIDNEI